MAAAEVLVHLDRAARVPLRTQLEQQLRELIRSGVLRAGTVLPSSRILAADLGVSRRLVVEAYQQLVAEGYLSATERATTRVEAVTAAGADTNPDTPPLPRYDLRPGVPALFEFPRNAWAKAVSTAIRDAPDAAFGYPDPRGSSDLRRAVADYLRRVRAVAAEPERVVICAGFTQALYLLTQALDQPVIALEDPGALGRDRTIAVAGGRHLGVPVDDQGMRTDRLPDVAGAAAVATPAHQFPLGVTLAPARRAQLLDWAHHGHLVIEDDYDAEFRYDRQPIGALQGLAPDHVAYAGTVSKTVAPAIRLGWLVLPSSLVPPVVEAKWNHDGGSPTLDQLALAELIASGAYERHLRRARRRYRQRRDQLLAALREHLPDAETSGTAAGLHLVLRLRESCPAQEIVQAALANDLAVAPLDRYRLGRSSAADNRLVVSYANITAGSINPAVRRLAASVATLNA